MHCNDASAELQARVWEGLEAGHDFSLVGGNSKHFLGRCPRAKPLPIGHHCGVVAYEETELALTARGGTPLAVLHQVLAEKGQMLPFEPPAFAATATIGGTVACGLSGPRRAYAGAVRDFVLGVKLLNGKGEILNFGGRVMKNVAGYDVSRLMAGAMGTLGVVLEVSMKVLPMPAVERTRVFAMTAGECIRRLRRWALQPLPVSGSFYHDGQLFLRLSGTRSGVQSAQRELGGEPCTDDDIWQRIREQSHPFFATSAPLWRLSVPPATPELALPGIRGIDQCIEWGGALRWVRSDAPATLLRETAAAAGGHAALFRGGDRNGEVMPPLPSGLLALHQRLKSAFDPKSLFNRGRLYSGF